MIRTDEAPTQATVNASVDQLADEILDRLPVTDKFYFHLDYTSPLVRELAARVQAAHPPPARILIIGSDSLLPLVLRGLGYEIDLWHFRQGHLIPEVAAQVRATVTPRQLAEADLTLADQAYDVIIAPFILESLPGPPLPFLARLRPALRPEGSILLATTNVSRLDLRLLAARGGNPAGAFNSGQISLSWPSLPHQRYFHRAELSQLATEAGFWLRDSAFVLAHKPYTLIDYLKPSEFLRRQAADWLMRLWPSARQAIVARLSLRVADQPRLSDDGAEWPKVSVIVGGVDDDVDLRQTLVALTEQDYPADRYEVIVLQTETATAARAIVDEFASQTGGRVRRLSVPAAEGPTARNAGMAAANGDICAHTDADCQPLAVWLQTIALAFDDRTGVVTGPVLDQPGSHPPYLVLPGSRPRMWDNVGLYPIANVAYRRQLALAAGGFAETTGGDPWLPLFWDTELAYRVQRLGWTGRFQKDLFLYRLFRPPQRYAWLQQQWRLAQDLPQVIKQTPELAAPVLRVGHFAAKETFYFDLLMLGLGGALVCRQRRWLLLTLPWLGRTSHHMDVWPASRWLPSARLLAGLGLRHMIWLAGLLQGSIKARRFIL